MNLPGKQGHHGLLHLPDMIYKAMLMKPMIPTFLRIHQLQASTLELAQRSLPSQGLRHANLQVQVGNLSLRLVRDRISHRHLPLHRGSWVKRGNNPAIMMMRICGRNTLLLHLIHRIPSILERDMSSAKGNPKKGERKDIRNNTKEGIKNPTKERVGADATKEDGSTTMDGPKIVLLP